VHDGEPAHTLGAFVGNHVGQIGIWSRIIDKIDASLHQWGKSHPTYDGKRLIINMVVGGLTQYLTCVQGMPLHIEQTLTRRIQRFMTDESPAPMVGLTTFQRPLAEGGKCLLDLKAHNQAIDLVCAQSYLDLTHTRPKWAILTDHLM